MEGEMKSWNGQVEIGSYKELMPVTISHVTEEYTIGEVTLTAEQAESIAIAYNHYQEFKSKQDEYIQAMDLKKIMNGVNTLKQL